MIGHARSEDLRRWEVLPPLIEPGDYGHMEVPQLAQIAGRCYLFFSVDERAHSAARRGRVDPVSGTHYLVADDPLGPWRSTTDEFFCGSPDGSLYSGKVIQDPDGRWVFLAFEQFSAGREFVGRLADPAPIAIDADGALRLAQRGVEPRDDLHS